MNWRVFIYFCMNWRLLCCVNWVIIAVFGPDIMASLCILLAASCSLIFAGNISDSLYLSVILITLFAITVLMLVLLHKFDRQFLWSVFKLVSVWLATKIVCNSMKPFLQISWKISHHFCCIFLQKQVQTTVPVLTFVQLWMHSYQTLVSKQFQHCVFLF